ncbi:putative porin [Trinickia symbiotica]|uniref:Porin n=1 Tax=Trinickia symbiotica TaxID=863227 RepID=A0A2N7X5L7_9BURK|nr:porin [Trinickia symbiotica]PMS37056.1 porin [Trinickia symbiotica]PPK43006.1 putative porin [Trinickia symbiotica]
MKKSLIALAVTSAVAAPAFAQNSVTLYGVIDIGITYVNNTGGHSQWQMQDGIVQGSRWGLKGVEDLGGGTKAIFQLENGFHPANGGLAQHGREFGRQAYVGLTNDSYGTLTLGRQYDPVVDMAQATTFNGQWGALFSHPADIDNTDNGFRINNAVKYVSPKVYGLQAEAMYAFGGQAGAFSSQSTVGGGLSFSTGPLYVGAGYFYAKDPAVQFNDGNFLGNTTPPSLAAAPTDGIWGLVGSPSNMQVISAGATYNVGPLLVGGNFSNVRFDNAKGVGGNTVWFNSYELWGQYSLTPAATLGAGYTFTNGKDHGTGQRPKYGQVNAIADYALSKRTDVYLLGSYQHAMSGGVTADIYSGLFAGGASTNSNQVSARVAIRHKF